MKAIDQEVSKGELVHNITNKASCLYLTYIYNAKSEIAENIR